LPIDRINQLEELGIRWRIIPKRDLEVGYRALVAFNEKYGHSDVPESWVAEDGMRLGKWLGRQRLKRIKGKLAPELERRLEMLGVAWQAGHHYSFRRGIEALKRFHKENGHVKVPSDFLAEGGFNLYNWANRQFKEKERGELSIARTKELEQLGFVLERNKLTGYERGPSSVQIEYWEKGFNALRLYKEIKGHCDVPARFINEDGFKLGQWVHRQKKFNRTGELHSERILRLEALGLQLTQGN
jgi:hypothetical protein